MAGGCDPEVGDLNKRVAQLERGNDELRPYLAALIRSLGCKGVLTREESGRVVDAVDAEDGIADGGYTGDLPAEG